MVPLCAILKSCTAKPALPLLRHGRHQSLQVTLARDVRPCRPARELLGAIVDVISTYVDIPADRALVVATFVLSTWFPDCFEAVPYLWIVGLREQQN